MSEWKTGQIVWHDLTVPNAEETRDFYTAVMGWSWKGEPMGDYEDYMLYARDDERGVAGVCYARDTNAGVPPQWLIYFVVDDIDASISAVEMKGGRVVDGPRMMGRTRFAAIQDPAGAVCAIVERPGESS